MGTRVLPLLCLAFSLFSSSALVQTVRHASASAGDLPFLPVNPWQILRRFADLHVGDSRPGLAYLKRYLFHFGYLPPLPDGGAFSDVFDSALESALLAYQTNFHLNATGWLDPSTLDLMIQPRCGVADVINGTNTMLPDPGRSLYSYFPGSPVWPSDKRKLRYAVEYGGVSLTDTVVRTVFARAFARWAEVTVLSFAEVTSVDRADIVIGFYKGDHGDGEPFDGPLGTLAHAFSPTDGKFHLDGAERWTAVEADAASPDLLTVVAAVDLESVAVHEIGHLLGLGHSPVEGSIMFPSIKSGSRRVQLTDDDVKGVQSLYGNNPNFNGTFSGWSGTMAQTEIDGGQKLIAGNSCLFVAAATAAVVALLVS